MNNERIKEYASEFINKTDKNANVSISAVQRTCGICYNHALYVLEEMERMSIVKRDAAEPWRFYWVWESGKKQIAAAGGCNG